MKKENNDIKKWILPKPININLKSKLIFSQTLQKVLIRRGIIIEKELNEYLFPPNLPNMDSHFQDLNKASERIIQACNVKDKIAICGDYDADGITSTYLLVELLSDLGADAIPYIPSRKEDGYGLNTKMIDEIYKKGIRLVITVDNGISAFEAIQHSRSLGIDLIITDHHKIPDKQLDFFALIHPEKAPIDSPYKYLAGVGIAYMLAKYICNIKKINIDDTSANVLFCIGTIADMAPLLGANRKWLKECLPKIRNCKNIGIRAIFRKLNFDKTGITTNDIGYKIAPVINAVGRIDDPGLIIDLFTSNSEKESNKLANKCIAVNKLRRTMTLQIEDEAIDIINKTKDNKTNFIVVTKSDWHIGVIGIVAARILEKYNLPTAILSEANDGLYRGSIRSNHLLKANKVLYECDYLLESYGGHSAAGGFTIKKENIKKLENKLNKLACVAINNMNIEKVIKPEAHLKFKQINYQLYDQLELLGPFGMKNEQPVFWSCGCTLEDIYIINQKHTKLSLSDGTGIIDGIKWNYKKNLQIKDKIDIAFHIEKNNWKHSSKLQLNILDVKKHTNIKNIHLHNRLYTCKLNGNNDIIIKNNIGNCISSDIIENLNFSSKKEELFAKKILSFAEIALGESD